MKSLICLVITGLSWGLRLFMRVRAAVTGISKLPSRPTNMQVTSMWSSARASSGRLAGSRWSGRSTPRSIALPPRLRKKVARGAALPPLGRARRTPFRPHAIERGCPPPPGARFVPLRGPPPSSPASVVSISSPCWRLPHPTEESPPSRPPQPPTHLAPSAPLETRPPPSGAAVLVAAPPPLLLLGNLGDQRFRGQQERRPWPGR